jgi:hypothetical protein
MRWTREFCFLYPDFFLSLTLISPFFADSKIFLLRDDDELKKDATAAPLLDALTVSKELSQEETVMTKSLTVPPAKSTPTRASKRLKKTAAVGTSLEAHRSAASSKDVSIASCS